MVPKQLTLADAQLVRQTLMQGGEVDWHSVEMPLAPEDVAQPSVDPLGLQRSLLKLKNRFPNVLPPKSRDGTMFDSEAAVLIHRSLRLDDATAAHQGFWAWISLRYFWDIINWRHGSRREPAIPENFSITKRHHGLLERLWFRAELGQMEGGDPYRFVLRATDRDFWESGVVRHSYSSCRAFGRAFIRYQFQDGRGRLHLTDPGGVRELYKRACRIYATVALDVLDEKQAFDLITELATGLKKAGTGASQRASG